MSGERTSGGLAPIRWLYGLLDNPTVYQLVQHATAPGYKRLFGRFLGSLRPEDVAPSDHLDVGCGPESVLWDLGLLPVGVDISVAYGAEWKRRGQRYVVASSTELPFPDQTFGCVWSFGLFHHLNDDDLALTLKEMVRVCRVGGTINAVDNFMPESWLPNPIPRALRKLDRGRHVRQLDDLVTRFPKPHSWKTTRAKYTYTGLEAVAIRAVRLAI